MNAPKTPYKFISISCDEATITSLDNIRTAFKGKMGGRIPSRSKMVRELLKWMERALPTQTKTPKGAKPKAHTTPTTPTDLPSIDYNAPFDGDNMPLITVGAGIKVSDDLPAPYVPTKIEPTVKGLASMEGDWANMQDFKGQTNNHTGDQPNG